MKFGKREALVIGLVVVGVSAIGVANWPQEPAFERLTVEVVKEYPHDAKAFTQGLEFREGALWESTGRHGQSTIRRVRLSDGVVEAKAALPRKHFGEGIAKVGDHFVQLTWKSGVAYRWKSEGFEPMEPLAYDGEGWGLCFDGSKLVMSNGTDRLSFRDPKTMKETGYLRVRLHGERLSKKINELECVGDRIYANVWREDLIYRIEKSTGKVSAVIGAQKLRPQARGAEVLNGIAYHPDRKTFFVTGKFWPVLYEVRFRAP